VTSGQGRSRSWGGWPWPGSDGYSLVEVLCVCLLVAMVAGVAIPQTAGVVSRARTIAAARYLAAQLQSARGQAAARNTYVGVQVTVRGSSLVVATFRDGNRNGVRNNDIVSGVDPLIVPAVDLGALFPGTEAGGADGLEPAPTLVDEISLYSFGPNGTASSGTVYLRGRDVQYGVRVLGSTGRVRVVKYESVTGSWVDVR
jgi:type II secretory pathway pseudopilin PulG